jgi:large conductance mechanosensitive channel
MNEEKEDLQSKNLNPIINKEIEEYKKFAFDKNMVQVAIGLILANAFQKTVTGLSDYLLMPVVNYFINSTDGNWRDLVFSPLPGMNIEVGRLAGIFCDFFIITFILYIVYSKVIKKIWPEMQLKFR